MIDRDKVIKALEICAVGTNACTKCPLKDSCKGTSNAAMSAAIKLLKEQEPDLPGTWLLDRSNHYKCSVYGAQWGQAARMMRHCPDCGRRMEI